MATDPLDDLLDAPDAVAWRAEPGDRIKGKVVATSEGNGDYGPYPIITLQDTDGALHAVHAFRTVLRNELAAKGVVIGDRVGILYQGKIDGKGGKPSYDGYKVAVEPGPNHYAAKNGTTTTGAAGPDPQHPALQPATTPATSGWDGDEEPF